MPVSPETETAAAYASGRLGATQGLSRGANPFVLDGTQLIQLQWNAWNFGFDDGWKDQVNANLYQNLGARTVKRPSVSGVITSAQVLALFTTPIQVIPAQAGFAHIPRSCVFEHGAGTAYTIAGVTAFGCLVAGSLICGTGAPLGFLDSATAPQIKMLGPGNGGLLFSGSDIFAYKGLALFMGCLGANPAAGNFSFRYTIEYDDVSYG